MTGHDTGIIGHDHRNTHKAVVRGDTGTVFAVVSDRYQLLHNSRAIDLGKKAFQHLFPDASFADFIVFDIHTTKTGSACTVDLIHKSYSIDVWEQETWLPFLRVSNSYNRYRALAFDFGFVRELCSNGIIFQKETIHARFYHTKGKLEIDLKQDKTFRKLKQMESEFCEYMKRLKAKSVSEKYLLALSIYLLNLEFDLSAADTKKRDQEKSRLEDVKNSLEGLIKKYVAELGKNAYSALNAATDLATHAPLLAGPFATSSILQQQIGNRARDFLALLDTREDIDIESALERQLQLVG